MLFYVAMIMMFFNSASFLFMWMMLEVLSMMFINMIYNLNFNKSSMHNTNLSQSSFNYFVYQMTFSLMLLILMVSNEMYFMISNEVMLFLLFTLILIKMGSLPYFYWLVKTSESMDGLTFSILMTIHKLPMFFLILTMYSENLNNFMLLNLLGGSILIFSSSNLKYLLITSSMYNLFWLTFIFYNSMMMFYLFYMIYMSVIFMIYKEGLFKKTNLDSSTINSLIIVLIMMILISSPPFGLFFMKFYTINVINNYSSNMLMFLIMTFILATIGYINFFYKMMTLTESMYSNFFSKKSKFLMTMLVSTFFIYF